MTGPQSFSINAQILSLCSTGIIILLFERNAYKSEVKLCAEEESEDEIQLVMNTRQKVLNAMKAQNTRKTELTSDTVI